MSTGDLTDAQWERLQPSAPATTTQGQVRVAALRTQADAAGHRDWEAHDVDGTVIRAYLHAAGAKTRR